MNILFKIKGIGLIYFFIIINGQPPRFEQEAIRN